jgi:hypothetical protein
LRPRLHHPDTTTCSFFRGQTRCDTFAYTFAFTSDVCSGPLSGVAWPFLYRADFYAVLWARNRARQLLAQAHSLAQTAVSGGLGLSFED